MNIINHPTVFRAAGSDTLLGLLQRGRGLGYQLALRTPQREVHDALRNCLIVDPRYVPEAEERVDYYGDLIVETNFDVASLETFLRSSEAVDDDINHARMALETLDGLVRRGHTAATLLMANYVDYGYFWDKAVSSIAASPNPEWWSRIEPALQRRASNSMDDKIWFDIGQGGPWQEWRADCPALDAALRRQESAGTPDRAEVIESLKYLPLEVLLKGWCERRSLSLLAARQRVTPEDEPELLRMLDSPDPQEQAFAVYLLAELRAPSLAPRLPSLWIGSQSQRGALTAAIRLARQRLPAELVLSWGREWAADDDLKKRAVGADILRQHWERADVPVIRDLLRTAVAAQDWFLACVVEAFQRVPSPEASPEIEAVYAETTDSIVRGFAAKALHSSNPHLFRSNYASECLHDCEKHTQALGQHSRSEAD